MNHKLPGWFWVVYGTVTIVLLVVIANNWAEGGMFWRVSRDTYASLRDLLLGLYALLNMVCVGSFAGRGEES